MARAKQASKQKRRRIALPALAAAGMSLTMAGGASATAPTANVSSQDTGPLSRYKYELHVCTNF